MKTTNVKKPKKMSVYLGWDGSYVLSKYPLTVHTDNSEGERLKYLSTGELHSIDDLGIDSVVFKELKLKKYQVVRLDITVVARGTDAKVRTRKK